MPSQPRSPSLRENAGSTLDCHESTCGVKFPAARSTARNSRTSARTCSAAAEDGAGANAKEFPLMRARSRQGLYYRGIRHAAALAHGLQSVARTLPSQLVDQGGHQPGTCRAQWMAEGNGTAEHVGKVVLRASLAHPGDHHGSEGLVDLEQVNVC